MASVDIQGTSFEVVEAGTGDPLILVHGSASDYRTWQAQRGVFAERFRVIAYSRRYHWPNDPIPDDADYAMTEQVDDLQQLLEALDAAPAHLVGHSYGAFLCLLLALRAPSLVRTLVLAEPPVLTLFVSDPPKPMEMLKLLVRRPRTATAIIKFGARGVVPATKALRRGKTEEGVRIFGDAVLGSGGYDRLSESRKKQVHDNLSSARAELLGPGFAPLEADQVRRLQTPTLLINGVQGVALFRRLADGLEALLPQAERAEIPAAAHMMHEDNASAFNAAVLSFLARAPQDARPSD